MEDWERKTNPKGRGAHYGETMKALNPTHIAVLKMLSKHGGLTKAQVTQHLNDEADANNLRFVAGCTISGRLSELCGAGLVKMQYEKVEVTDYDSMQFRFKKRPVWRLTPKALEILAKEQPQCTQ
ncbi:MAG: replication-relaxation family protein [Candidatus Bathyarchaeota archaeon]|nr:replication-relaxation family protein [Candidatus Bathyarchaeota archaeon]